MKVKTTLNLADYIVAEVKKLASERGISMKDYIEQCLKAAIQAEKNKIRDFKLRKHTFKGNGVSPELDEDNLEQIRNSIYKGRGS